MNTRFPFSIFAIYRVSIVGILLSINVVAQSFECDMQGHSDVVALLQQAQKDGKGISAESVGRLLHELQTKTIENNDLRDAVARRDASIEYVYNAYMHEKLVKKKYQHAWHEQIKTDLCFTILGTAHDLIQRAECAKLSDTSLRAFLWKESLKNGFNPIAHPVACALDKYAIEYINMKHSSDLLNAMHIATNYNGYVFKIKECLNVVNFFFNWYVSSGAKPIKWIFPVANGHEVKVYFATLDSLWRTYGVKVVEKQAPIKKNDVQTVENEEQENTEAYNSILYFCAYGIAYARQQWLPIVK